MAYQTVPIVLRSGLQQKNDPKVGTPGELYECLNGEFDKTGAINKRRGYELVDPQQLILTSRDGVDHKVETLAHALGLYEDELVIFGYDYAYALVSRDKGVTSQKTAVFRGPISRGALRRQDVTGAGVANTIG